MKFKKQKLEYNSINVLVNKQGQFVFLIKRYFDLIFHYFSIQYAYLMKNNWNFLTGIYFSGHILMQSFFHV